MAPLHFQIAVEHVTRDGPPTLTTHTVDGDPRDSRIDYIHQHVGGYITTAFTVPSPLGGSTAIVGYVHDEGLVIGLPIKIAVRYPNGSVTLLAGSMLMQGVCLTTGESLGLDDAERLYLTSLRQHIPWLRYGDRLFPNVAFYDFQSL